MTIQADGNWVPSVRLSFVEDFEDRFSQETGASLPQNALRSSEIFFSGSNLDFNMFLDIAFHEGNMPEAQRDWALRHAAARGSLYALMDLANKLYESGRNDEEAWRWAKRFQFAVTQPVSEFEDFYEGSLAERETWSANMQAVIDGMQAEHPHLAHQLGPTDVGRPGIFNYCLRCGKLRDSSAPLDQCNDSVHLVAVRVPADVKHDSINSEQTPLSRFCSKCGLEYQDQSFRYCSGCGNPR